MGPKELPAVKEEEEDEEEEEEMETVVMEAPEEKWDCETIISEFKYALRFTCSCVVEYLLAVSATGGCLSFVVKLSLILHFLHQQLKHASKILFNSDF